MAPKIFLSHASNDRWDVAAWQDERERCELPYFTTFRKAMLNSLQGVFGETPDLWIDEDIEPGARWKDALTEALAEADFLLALLSPSYFNSPNTAREWVYFRDRAEAAGAGTRLFGVPWHYPRRFATPPVVAENQIVQLQDTRDLRQAAQVSNDLIAVCDSIAESMSEVNASGLLPRAQKVPRWDDIVPEFGDEAAPAAPAAPAAWGDGPPTLAPAAAKTVRYVVVTGTRSDMEGRRADIGVYGDDVRDWKPLQPNQNLVGRLTQRAAELAEMVAEHTTYIFPADLQPIQEVVSETDIYLVVVDPWSVRLPAVGNAVKVPRSPDHCAVIIPWSGDVDDTDINALLPQVRACFVSHRTNGRYHEFCGSETDFQVTVADVLQELQTKYAEAVEITSAGAAYPTKPTVSAVTAA